MKHTKEPWKESFGSRIEARPPKGFKKTPEHPEYIIAQFHCFVTTTAQESDANVRRAIACVNALAGIDDPAAFVVEAKRRGVNG